MVGGSNASNHFILTAMLVADISIHGVALSVSTQVKIVQYADDINVFINSVTDMHNFLSILHQYELASESEISVFGLSNVDIGTVRKISI